jgi:hypothetical protein
MRKFLAILVASVVSVSASLVAAQSGPVVVELYTSQGCSSCPPADEMLHELAGRSDVIALALHVDYWDYIGWKDEFGNPAFTQRQHQYARVAGARSVFTPQFVIGGRDHVVGAKMMDVMDQIRGNAERLGAVTLTIRREGDRLQIAAQANPPARQPLVVQLVRYTPQATVEIRRGENAGRTISYSNIVTSWDQIGEWDGAAPLSLAANISGGSPVVVIVQRAGQGPILAAAELR